MPIAAGSLPNSGKIRSRPSVSVSETVPSQLGPGNRGGHPNEYFWGLRYLIMTAFPGKRTGPVRIREASAGGGGKATVVRNARNVVIEQKQTRERERRKGSGVSQETVRRCTKCVSTCCSGPKVITQSRLPFILSELPQK